jgi:enamine deaminase RidA (YjgF/YER057c/UK114 family)
MRQRFSTGTPWEPIVGYSRAVRTGNLIHVSGTTATDERGEVVAPGDIYRQAVATLANIRRAIESLGGTLDAVVRTRIYVTDITQWQSVARAHGEVFGTIRPATAMIEVSRFIHPDMLVEIEADAVIE